MSARRLGPALLVEGPAVLQLKALVEMGVRFAAKDGIRPSPATERLRRVIAETAATVMSERGHADVREEPTGATSEVVREDIDTKEVARMTGLSDRQARRLTSDLGGRKTRSGTWLIERALVEAHILRKASNG